ncbi:MAG: tyrosine-type recombinase/integrase [Planctomycetaceae bacterium]|nr:tyrosine-type recombinase/integrase [Planctomycetaceae bacterium]
MAFHRLDENGKAMPRKGKGRTNRKPAEREERGKTLYHYEITSSIKLDQNKRRQVRRRFWLENDDAAAAKERELRHKAPTHAMTWVEAHKRWIEGNKGYFSVGHINNARTTIRQWTESFGAASTIEGTDLATFNLWIGEHAKKNSGRGAQIKFGHLMAIARWCRKRGYISAIPFEHTPKPRANLKERAPASKSDYQAILQKLDEHHALVWELLGLTGMRLGAACGLQEEDIGEKLFVVTTKGGKRVPYPVTPEIQDLFDRARKWKRKNKFKNAKTLFCNLAGHPWTSTTLGRYFDKATDAAGMPKVTAHQLRHMAGTVAGKKNFSADYIQALLGHGERESSDRYVSKDLEMREIGIQALATFLQENDTKIAEVEISTSEIDRAKNSVQRDTTCPRCGHNFKIIIKLKPQPE